MKITIELEPEETKRFSADAERQGTSLERYLHQRISNKDNRRKLNITDLEGLGKEIWEGVDVKEYLDELRDY